MKRAGLGALVAGRYRLRAVAGRGGMGVVWRAVDEVAGRDVAVREIVWPPRLGEAGRGELCQRVLREARTAAQLDHPSVIRVYDVVEDGARPWIVMPLIGYPSLGEVVREHGPLPPRRAARIGGQILDALEAAHAAGVLHGDVQPGNVLLGPEDQVVLTDFGLAIADGSTALTTSGVLIGSPAYMAPERVRGEPATPAADMWSLGAAMYAAVEGRPPVDRQGAPAIFAAIVGGLPGPPVRAGPLWLVIGGLLRKDPAERLGAAEAGRLLRQAAGAGSAAPGAPPAEATVPLAAVDRPAAGTVVTGRSDRPRERAPAGEEAHRGAGPAGAVRAGVLIPGLEPRPHPRPGVPGSPPPPGQSPGNRRGGLRWHHGVLVLGGVVAAALVAVTAIALLRSGPARHRLAAPAAHRPAAHQASAAHRHHQHSGVSSAPPRPVPPAPPTPATPGRAGATPPAPGSSGPGPLPAGFFWYHDPSGFSIGVPPGWQVSHEGHLAYVRDPGSGRFLIIDQTTHPKPGPLADWRRQEAARRGTYRGYRLIRLQAVRYAQAERAADWEFTYHYRSQLIHVLNRNILANAHHAYALYWSTPASQWRASFPYFREFAATFRPAGTAQAS